MSKVLILGSRIPAAIALDAVTNIPDIKSIVMSRDDPKFVVNNDQIYEKFGGEIMNREYSEFFKLDSTNEPNLLFINPATENINSSVDLSEVDVVINAATITDAYYVHHNSVFTEQFNVDLPKNILSQIDKHTTKSKRPFFIDFSNTHIYDGIPLHNNGQTPFKEEEDVSKPKTARAKMLYKHEQTVNKLAKQYGIPYTIWRLSTIIGESSSRGTFPSHVALSIFNRNDIVIEGNGKQCRDYVSSNVLKQNIQDSVQSLISNDESFINTINGQTYNFGMGEPNKFNLITLANAMFSLLKEFKKETGWQMPEITHTGWRFGKKQNELFDIWVSIKKATKDLPYNVKRPTSFVLGNHLLYIATRHTNLEGEVLETLTKKLYHALPA